MSTKRLLWCVAVFAVGLSLLASMYAGWRLRATLRPEHKAVRGMAILSQAGQGDYDAVVIGDSMVELADLRTVCGGGALNAGVGGATVQDLVELTPKLLSTTHPKRVIFVVGVNDAARRNPTKDAEFERGLSALTQIGVRSGAIVRFATIAPIRTDLPVGRSIDPARVTALNQIIERQPGFIPVGRNFPNGLSPAQTLDGVHLSRLGYEPWLDAMVQGCATQG